MEPVVAGNHTPTLKSVMDNILLRIINYLRYAIISVKMGSKHICRNHHASKKNIYREVVRVLKGSSQIYVINCSNISEEFNGMLNKVYYRSSM